ncbi:MAG: UDP-3-O-acyl-N-acetylglucosamine deacetylase [Halioglobus sp.]|nr:UDP-3-O-acyl-N-acetylglucosamine deacetylase [Halioglobus sp.]
MLRQQTLARAVETAGIGLHTGLPVQLRLQPAPAGTGVVFRRIDKHPVVNIAARAENVSATQRSTTLSHDGAHVGTVEHLLAALVGMQVDNAYVDVSAPELPIMDGSAAPFARLIRSAGVLQQPARRVFLRVLREVVVEDGDKVARFLPFDGFRVAFTIDFDQPVFRDLGTHAVFDDARDTFVDDLSAARTFGFLHEVEALRARGLALGAGFENALVLDEHRVLNTGGLRYADEPVRHKILDALGDLALLGAPLLGEFRAVKSGHALNTAAVRALLAQPDAWERVSAVNFTRAAVAGTGHGRFSPLPASP